LAGIGVLLPVGAAVSLAAAGPLGIVALPFLGVPVAAGYGVYRLARRHRAQSERIPPKTVVPLQPKWGSAFSFPPGHPINGIVYVAHPVKHKYYIPIADFHRKVFEDKFSELVSILLHLGATKIEVTSVQGWSRGFSERLSVDLPKAVGLPKAGGTRERGVASNDLMVLFYDDTLKGSEEPELPPELSWYPHERTWQNLVESRMKRGSNNFELNIFYNDDYGINSMLKAEIEDARLNLGGSFEEYTSTIWKIRGIYK
jgi:hypothetical protein